MNHTLGQQRAAYCLGKLDKISCKREDFKPFSAGLPAMILQNGFGQTLAFLLAKGKTHHTAGFEIISDWLIQRNLLLPGSKLEILKQISSMEQVKYLQAQKETLAMLEWLKRYANAALFEEQS